MKNQFFKNDSVIINLPLRDMPTEFPPMAPLAIKKYLKKGGFDPVFLNFDLFRSSIPEMVDRISKRNPKIVGISAPVSTGYSLVKEISLAIKKKNPEVVIILGGNLAASAELLLKNTGVDICVLGEGEIPALELFRAVYENWPIERYREIQGIMYIHNGALVNTGYAPQLSREDIFDIDWDDLGEDERNTYFPLISDTSEDSFFATYFLPDLKESNVGKKRNQFEGKRIATVICSKGCGIKCTFCHRFLKGIRFIPIPILEKRIKYLIKKFDVAAISFADECFGCNKAWLLEFCEMIKPLNLVWRVGGMRTSIIDKDILRRMRESGCRTIIYGIESGSEEILSVMEKRISMKQNYEAMQLTAEMGLFTIPQLVIGMPGENCRTLKETAEFVAFNQCLAAERNPQAISVNYAQALPGTPLYEYARNHGFIGQGLEEEERYLLSISDRNAADETTTLNFTDYPSLILLSFRSYLYAIVQYRYIQKFGKKHYENLVFPGYPGVIEKIRQSGITATFPEMAYRLRCFLWIFPLLSKIKRDGLFSGIRSIWELVIFFPGLIWSRDRNIKSLRKIVEVDEVENSYSGAEAMVPLRKGR